ncbi:hypothetical protein ACTXGQ_15405 [Marinobacter sp. 1Y8]
MDRLAIVFREMVALSVWKDGLAKPLVVIVSAQRGCFGTAQDMRDRISECRRAANTKAPYPKASFQV